MERLTAGRLRELLRYDPESGAFFWVAKSARRANRVPVGKEAGYLGVDGRRQIRLDGKLYKAHRLVWLHVFGHWPKEQIDHINNDPSDNRLCNLREATNRENCRNMPLTRPTTDFAICAKRLIVRIAATCR
jgi:HNH endonuclease